MISSPPTTNHADRTAVVSRVPDGVEGACHTIDLVLHANRAHEFFDCPPVARAVKGPVVLGRADYVFIHADGSATVVEVADDRGDHFVLSGGLSRLCLHATPIAMVFHPAKVRRVLACNCYGTSDEYRTKMCANVGVLFVPLATNEQRRIALRQAEAASTEDLQ